MPLGVRLLNRSYGPCSGRADTEPHHMGIFGSALLELAARKERQALLKGWRQPSQQRDVAEFLAHLIDPHCAPFFLAGALAGLSVMNVTSGMPELRPPSFRCRRKVCPTSRTLSRSGTNSLKFTRWNRAPNILLIMLGRLEHRGRCVRKLRHVIHMPTSLHIPTFSGQGASTHQKEHTLFAGAIHVGDQAHTGHDPAFSVPPHPEVSSMRGTVAETTILRADGDFFIHDDNAGPVSHNMAHLQLLRHNAYVLALQR